MCPGFGCGLVKWPLPRWYALPRSPIIPTCLMRDDRTECCAVRYTYRLRHQLLRCSLRMGMRVRLVEVS